MASDSLIVFQMSSAVHKTIVISYKCIYTFLFIATQCATQCVHYNSQNQFITGIKREGEHKKATAVSCQFAIAFMENKLQPPV